MEIGLKMASQAKNSRGAARAAAVPPSLSHVAALGEPCRAALRVEDRFELVRGSSAVRKFEPWATGLDWVWAERTRVARRAQVMVRVSDEGRCSWIGLMLGRRWVLGHWTWVAYSVQVDPDPMDPFFFV